MTHNFRTAFNGFHKEDVVHYLEYIHTKHQTQVNRLNAEIEELRSSLAAASVPSVDTELEARCRSLEEENRTLQSQKDALEQKCAELAKALPAAAASPIADSAIELDAYRRAERIEKEARDRAELIYFQASTALANAASRVEGASADVTALTDQVMGQIMQLQVAVSAGKQALQEAASVISTIRPNR